MVLADLFLWWTTFSLINSLHFLKTKFKAKFSPHLDQFLLIGKDYDKDNAKRWSGRWGVGSYVYFTNGKQRASIIYDLSEIDLMKNRTAL